MVRAASSQFFVMLNPAKCPFAPEHGRSHGNKGRQKRLPPPHHPEYGGGLPERMGHFRTGTTLADGRTTDTGTFIPRLLKPGI
ncbi:hypothetical protein NDU88_003916 [Pleurodeles waltl]|uniref:Uncharacterized protein n=1 Tax=Pleurodeles waltl TaxID=8319 RepID=A0AAV7MRZ1_PLEWA|nr:hypothetical protein NDU88_003916 [Pleurodeles waltl]